MKYYQIGFLCLLSATMLCSCSDKVEVKEYWVNSMRVACVGEGPRRCLQVQQGEQVESGAWEYFYSTIEGFDFKEGFIYQLAVSEKSIENPPADGSSIRYQLVEVLSKEFDPKVRLHDLWVLEEMGEMVLDVEEQQRPRLEINLYENKIMGFDGCNSYTGSIESVGEKELVFGQIANTRKMCVDMSLSNRFHALMSQVKSYALEEGQLVLKSEADHSLFSFQKTD
ncbi:DUF4377 domain-containing protein [Reichenbachiella carrageenanivorans]|uniref:DUF4377 domain-containing protein n=1 Tax=Reichenbachiella carrageenanivorans TaxID=2979869 RepID=A0ABY6CY26_9BACT|nr:DUF4377 domain-containing protein [Reichenbachiella carrageenanivorans]UXX78773.1 DUF4377 domain-containing protein [Reichenbachiella carrageenanivorans]